MEDNIVGVCCKCGMVVYKNSAEFNGQFCSSCLVEMSVNE
jgi:hypothetical protein